jgi:hypothetical protein
MNQTKYISIDSTFRDRTKDPLPGEFEVIFSNSGMKDRFSAVDPVCYSAPEIVFNSYFDLATPSITLSGTILATTTVTPIGNTTSQQELICQFTGTNILSTIKNYYQGAILVNTTTNTRSRILEYSLINNNNSGNSIGTFLLTSSIGSVTNGDTIKIVSPTDFSNSKIFVPSGIVMSNAYINDYLINDTLSTSTSIIKAKITNYDVVTKTLTADTSSWVGSSSSDVLSIRSELPFINTLDATSTSSNITFTLPSSFLSFPLVGSFIKFYNSSTVVSNTMRKIVNVSTSTSKPIITVDSPFPSNYTAGAKFEFLPFSRDNMVPLTYSGSIISQQELSCYEIQLIDLILPNNILNVDGGGLTSTYPYVFVGLTNTSASGYNNVIYSNNPYARNMLFKVAIPNVNDPITTPFIRIINPNIIQTIKFKPNDNLKFVVLIPTGEVFNTVEADTSSPLLPLQALQISAQFSIRKLI